MENIKPLSVGDPLIAIRSYYGVGAATPETFPVTVASVGKRDVKVTCDDSNYTYVFRVNDAKREARNSNVGQITFHDPNSQTVADTRAIIAQGEAKNELFNQIEAVERHLRGYNETFDAEALRSAIDAYEAGLESD